MNNSAKLIAIVVSLAMLVCVVSIVSEDADAAPTNITLSPNDASKTLDSVIADTIYNSDEEVIVTLNKGEYRYTGNSYDIFKGKSLTVRAASNADVTIILDPVSGNPSIGVSTESSETSLTFSGVKFKPDSGFSRLDVYNYFAINFENCTFTDTILFRQSGSTPDETQNGSFKVTGCTFNRVGTDSTSDYAATIIASTIVFTDNNVDGYGRGPNLMLKEGDGAIIIADNKVSNLTHSKPIAFQISGDVEDRQVLFYENEVNGGIGLSIYYGLEVSENGAVVMGNNTFTDCDRDIFYAIDTEGEPSIDTKFSTPITLVYNDFIHDGESVDPVYGKEVEGTDPIANLEDSEQNQVKAAVGEFTVDWYTPGTQMSISNEDELKQLATLVNSGIDFAGETVSLTADISMNGTWTPIGDGSREILSDASISFSGKFIGNNHVITGLSVDGYIPSGASLNDDNSYMFGLFGYLSGDAEVSGLTFSSYYLEASEDAASPKADSIAALAGFAYGNVTISGITVKDGRISGYDAVGGILARSYGESITISDCVNNADVKATHPTEGKSGGIIGIISNSGVDSSTSEIKNSSSSGDSTAYYAGGIAGLANASIGTHAFSGCSVENITISSEGVAGGIIARSAVGVTVDNCDVTNSVITGGGNAGGIVGSNGGTSNTLTVNGCTVSGSSITAENNAGGLIGSTIGKDIDVIGGSVSGTKVKATSSSEESLAGGVIGSVSAGSTEIDVLIDSVEVSDDVELESLNNKYVANDRVNYGVTEAVAVAYLGGKGTFKISNMSDFGGYELISQSSFLSTGNENDGVTKESTITFSGITTSNVIGWMIQGYMPTVSIEDNSQIEGLQIDTQTIKLKMDGSSYIGQLIAGADSDRSKEIEDTCGFTGDTNYHGTFLIASGQTVTVGTAYETPETVYNTNGTRKYFGQITGEDSTSTLIVKEDGSDEAYLKAGSYVWNTVTSSWESAFIVTFDPNYEGGECTFQKIDGTANLTQNTFVRQGYTFLGWNTVADGSGDDYADRAEITATSGEPGITLYAQWKDPIARIDDTMYATISDAVDAAQGDVTIVLLGSTKESVTIPANKDIVLDLGTWTISNEDGKHTITVNSGATLTITGKGKVDNTSNSKAALYNEGTVIVNDGTFTRTVDTAGNTWYTVYNDGMMTFNGGTVTSDGDESSLIINGKGKEATMVINDGTFYKKAFNCLKNEEQGTITVKGGSFSGVGYAFQNWNKATIEGGTFDNLVSSVTYGSIPTSTLTIKDGTFNGNISSWNMTYGGGAATNAPSVSIEGGTFHGSILMLEGPEDNMTPTSDSTKASMAISGGDYDLAPAEYMLADGFALVQNPDGTYGITTEGEAVTITIIVDGKSESRTVTRGSTVPKDMIPVAPVHYGYRFLDATGSVWDLSSQVMDDMTLTAEPYIADIMVTVSIDGDVAKAIIDTPVEFVDAQYYWFYGVDSETPTPVGSDTILQLGDDGAYGITVVITDSDGVSGSGSYMFNYVATPDDQPFVPYPDDDDSYVPLPPTVVYEDSDDDATAVAACAAAAVAAAIIACLIIMDYRRR